MIRRLALPLACIAVLSGCATFTNNDVVASYNGTELDQAEFDERYLALAGEPVAGRYLGDPARTVVNNWIIEQVLVEAGAVERYESGPDASGILCASLIAPTDVAAAQAYVERLEQGDDWFDVLEADFPDVPDNGNVACIAVADLGPLAPQVAGMTLDDPYRVFFLDDENVVVLRMRPASEVDPFELAGAVQRVDPGLLDGVGELLESAVVVVDPQFGRFEIEAGGVVPLG